MVDGLVLLFCREFVSGGDNDNKVTLDAAQRQSCRLKSPTYVVDQNVGEYTLPQRERVSLLFGSHHYRFFVFVYLMHALKTRM